MEPRSGKTPHIKLVDIYCCRSGFALPSAVILKPDSNPGLEGPHEFCRGISVDNPQKQKGSGSLAQDLQMLPCPQELRPGGGEPEDGTRGSRQPANAGGGGGLCVFYMGHIITVAANLVMWRIKVV